MPGWVPKFQGVEEMARSSTAPAAPAIAPVDAVAFRVGSGFRTSVAISDSAVAPGAGVGVALHPEKNRQAPAMERRSTAAMVGTFVFTDERLLAFNREKANVFSH